MSITKLEDDAFICTHILRLPDMTRSLILLAAETGVGVALL